MFVQRKIMSSGSNLVVPVVLWGKSPPTHCVSCVYLSRDQCTLITGCYDGQICLWQVDPDTLKVSTCNIYNGDILFEFQFFMIWKIQFFNIKKAHIEKLISVILLNYKQNYELPMRLIGKQIYTHTMSISITTIKSTVATLSKVSASGRYYY